MHVIVFMSLLVFVFLTDRFGLHRQLHRLHPVHRLQAPWRRRLVSLVSFGSRVTFVAWQVFVVAAPSATCSAPSSSASRGSRLVSGTAPFSGHFPSLSVLEKKMSMSVTESS